MLRVTKGIRKRGDCIRPFNHVWAKFKWINNFTSPISCIYRPLKGFWVTGSLLRIPVLQVTTPSKLNFLKIFWQCRDNNIRFLAQRYCQFQVKIAINSSVVKVGFHNILSAIYLGHCLIE